MDPIAHTLVGATLAESGLRRKTPLATATLLLGANAPDIDFVSVAAGSDASLHFRRGITHGALALVVLPIALTGLILAFDRFVRRRAHPEADRAKAGVVLGLAFLSVLTHPFLDWLNTYGVRLLMPFDDRWFYGDSLFIIDPFLWLAMAAAVVLARSAAKPSIAAWIVVGCASSGLVLGVSLVPLAAKVVWILGIIVIAVLRLSGSDRGRIEKVARVCVALLAIYIGSMVAGTALARAEVRAWLARRGMHAETLAAAPIPANPFAREVIAVVGDDYHFVRRSFLSAPAFAFSAPPIPRGPRDAVTNAALGSPSVRGLRTWIRFPAFEVERSGDGYVVTIHDVRYRRRGASSLGTAVVRLDADLRPLSAPLSAATRR